MLETREDCNDPLAMNLPLARQQPAPKAQRGIAEVLRGLPAMVRSEFFLPACGGRSPSPEAAFFFVLSCLAANKSDSGSSGTPVHLKSIACCQSP